MEDNILSVVMEVGGKGVETHYVDGFTDETSVHCASMTKSVLALLIGIALDCGYLESIDKPVIDFFPDYHVKRGEKLLSKIKIRDLLSMRAPYKGKGEPYTRVLSSDDWTLSMLDFLGGKQEIGSFHYATLGTHILSGILDRVTPNGALQFANDHLFAPLGIYAVKPIAIRSREDYMAFIYGINHRGWVCDPQGVLTGGWGLSLSTQDFLKIGRLVLNGNPTIISNYWLDLMARPHNQWQDFKYGYLWWLQESGVQMAMGDGGNVLYVDRNRNVLVVILSRFKPRTHDRIAFIEKDLIAKHEISI
ncbi:serine hydrolase [Erysipelothrix sp. HDW6C]|uniref:serine hydrolase domain-containing protein n=1 Tax=Erysipelothrix sp. HDW6C TaxID=2714930 RepID=UPI00140BF88D|nr:serine hydrolase [Erysipelothrix sp. HDW6C]QIK70193.1 serine hydrolase [Erysipelothrix sp. HDW6C]